MRLKILLFAMLISVGVFAQDTIRSLVITEARLHGREDTYLEITNMGTKAVDLGNFEVGKITPWTDGYTGGTSYLRLPEKSLAPGKSYVLTIGFDFGTEQYMKKTPGFEGNGRQKQPEMYTLADWTIHMAEPKGDATDSITPDNANSVGLSGVLDVWWGREGWYIEQHLSETDSVVVDQVNGMFDINGYNNPNGRYNVAGVSEATYNSILVRKYSVKEGNLDFPNARGVGADDSEWMPIPPPASHWRDVYWTVGTHGDYKLDANILESDKADVDFANKTITVPWGTRRADGVMKLMKRKPGLAWEYILKEGTVADSLPHVAMTGDKLKLYVCGSKLETADFKIVVSEPTADVKVVVPVSNLDWAGSPNQWWRDQNEQGILDWPRVTEHASGTDTITGNWFGIPYATRIDSLQDRLIKPSNAKWEIVPANGVASPDLKNGDKLKVTAKNGSVKEYFIQVQPLLPNHNANLLSITWPDIPAEYRGLYGWMGDTIPSFNSTTYNYRIIVPKDVDGIPALVTKTENLNATVKVTRAGSINGTTEQRTISFEVTAEDDSVKSVYNIELVKEKDPANVQPYNADPFLSEFVFWDQWSNSFGEIANPGNQPLDLSNYMIGMNWNTTPASIIQSRMQPTDWLDRYDKYIPGYKWVNEAQWAVTPGIVEQDLNVNAIVMPGDVFAFGGIWTDGQTRPSWLLNYKWTVPAQLDIQFNMYPNNSNKQDYPNGYTNPWGEQISGNGSPVRKWSNSSWFMWKILNDSIKLGLKPANDPNDFVLIETWSMSSSTDWVIGGKKANMITNWVRKPQIYKGNTGFEKSGSFGTDPASSEWTYTDQTYWQKKNVGWPLEILNVGNDIGQHFMNEPTQYKSTVTSTVYQVSEGYSRNEKIKGMKTGTTVANFMGGITKANEKQTLKVKRANTELAMDAALLMNDTLTVMSADSLNITKYVLSVTADGLSPNAVITSTRYTVTIEQQPKSAGNENAGIGTVKGFDYGTALRTVLANIKLPAGASMTVINGEGAYVPLKTLNFDTAYVNVTVNDNIYLSVIAENGVTEIVYQLIPSTSENDAFVLSDIYSVVQKELLIQYVPGGTNVSTFMSNLVPNAGATIKLVNKAGQERLDGGVADDDKVVVTSKNGSVTKTYYISKLATDAVPETLYLAYILSNVYAVDQVLYTVAGVSGSETVSAFLTKVTPSAGASVAVVDKAGTVKINGDINGGDKVKVTSANGKMVAYYDFSSLTSSRNIESNNIELYPNPTNGEINVSGVKTGQLIQVYNSVGAVIRDVNVQNSIERISLRNQPAGMYMIVVSDNNKMIGRYKAMKQ